MNLENMTFTDFLCWLVLAAAIVYALRRLCGYIYYCRAMKNNDNDDFEDGNKFKFI